MMKSLFLSLVAGAMVLTAFSSTAADAPKPYPLKTCLVSDEKLGDMGDAYTFTHKGREVKLCCKSCLKDFNKDPETYIKKLDAAEKAGQKK